jgi:hypothetical protein
MIVHDAGDAWQLVLQVHHGDLAGKFAAAWGNDEFATPVRQRSLVIAATRHDDGWAVWERWPQLAPEDSRPVPFFEVAAPSHLDFYRAAITDISSQDPYAGLLVAMHGAGIYRNRYGMHPSLKVISAEEYRDETDAFVAELEETYPRRIAELNLPEGERWTDYKLLQVFDHISLYFSGLFDLKSGDVHAVSRVPLDYEGAEADVEVVPVAPFEPFSPRHVTMSPFPFVEAPARFTLERRVLRKGSWSSEEFRNAFYSTPTETVEILVERA